MPTKVDGIDLSGKPLDPHDYFVYTKVDGVLSVSELGEVCGLSEEMAAASIEKLSGHGLVAFSGPSDAASNGGDAMPEPEPVSERPKVNGTGVHVYVHAEPTPPGTSRALYDPAELDEEGVELGMERRRQVLDTYYRLDSYDHYALLGVARDAEKKEIRDAYFVLAKVFHPDTLFGKELGSFKSKMEAVFKHLTDAYEVLGKKKSRRAYDEYIGFQDQTAQAERAMDAAEHKAEAIERGEPVPPTDPPPKARRPAPAHRKADPAARRAAMAQRLAAATGRKPGSRPPQDVAEPTAEERRAQRLKSLKRSLQGAAAVRGSGTDLKAKHLAAADEAGGRKDWVGVANALRLAMAADPNDAELEARHAEVKHKVARQLADSYEHQAAYEEEHGNWEGAARSWKRVAAGRPDDARPLLAASRALLTAKADLHEARDLALEAKRLAPKDINAPCVLAEIFLELGLKKNAQREINAALKLDPKSEIVKNLQRTLKG